MKYKFTRNHKIALILFFAVVALVCGFVKTRLPVVAEHQPVKKNIAAPKVTVPSSTAPQSKLKPKPGSSAVALQPASQPVMLPPVKMAPPFVKKAGAAKTSRVLRPGAPKIVIVLDDLGHSTEHLDLLKGLGSNVTYAILPFLKHSGFFDQFSFQTGAEVILHMPLESTKGTIPGPGLILTSMSDSAAIDILRRSLASVPHAQGVNNHMGSKGTSDIRLMSLLMKEMRSSGLFFLDSVTTARSVSRTVGAAIHFPAILKRDVFLDNEDTQEAVRRQLGLLALEARNKGYAVGIGHYRYNTMKVLLEEIPRLKKQGYEFISLQELLRLKK